MSSNFILENEDIKHLFNGCIEQQHFKKVIYRSETILRYY